MDLCERFAIIEPLFLECFINNSWISFIIEALFRYPNANKRDDCLIFLSARQN